MIKKIISIVLTGAMCLSLLSFNVLADVGIPIDRNRERRISIVNSNTNTGLGTDNPDPGFKDVSKTDWFYDAVRFAVDNNIMDGTSKTSFDPNAKLTRAMTVTVLHRMQAGPSATYKPVFPDVQEGKWYSDAVIWANDNKIVEGYENGLFCPDDPVTREQLGIILYRYAKFINAETNFWVRPAVLESFVDGSRISDWALDAAKWCLTFDIIKGMSGGSGGGMMFAPKGNATRAQYATILQRFYDIFVNGNGIIPLPSPQPDDSMFGVDLNINQDTIDDWLGRDDVVYRDMRMLIDTANFDAMGEGAATVLKFTINGFKVVPWPYVANSSALPPVVGEPYNGSSLFTIRWNPEGGIDSVYANYDESMLIISELFPKDKAIFLMCGGGGYAAEMKMLLISLGWDETLIYNTGANWGYSGPNALELFMQSDDESGKYTFATWRADYAIFSFQKLTTHGQEITESDDFSITPPVIKGSDAKLPPAEPDTSDYGVDRNINMSNIDNWLGRDDVVYRDLRMFYEPAEYETMENGVSSLAHTINGFKIVPYPYIANPYRIPVNGAYNSNSLFNITWEYDGLKIIESDEMVNYEESIMILEELFPKDKKIFLLSGWVGYSYEMKTLLTFLGWNESNIYIVGSHWDYTGKNNIELAINPNEAYDIIYATWRADFAVINFNFLNPFPYYDAPSPPLIDPNNPGCIFNVVGSGTVCAC